ncbi:Salutaridinol 7-O-acetyltransferase, partial [Cucurbita argyrosperma subsp. sororia]
MEVKVLSRETIIPSSPTPPHLKSFKLSLLDQLSPMLYTPLLFFYPITKTYDPNPTMATLKDSLSQTLTRFYLLAGRIVGKSIHCSDQGAVFIEASVSCNMSHILKQPNNEVLRKLLPCSLLCSNPAEESPQVVVQANIFSCGGIAISLCLLHKLMDGATFTSFLTSWASTNKGSLDSSSNMICYDYKAFSSLFPQTNLLPFHQKLAKPANRKRCLRRFVFGTKSLLNLKAKAESRAVPNPSCVEALTGFIWKHAMMAADCQGSSTLSHVVNLRGRMKPALPEVSVGNIMWGAVAHSSAMERLELRALVGLLRQSFEEINKDYIERMLIGSDKGFEAVLKFVGEMNKWGMSNYYFCTSWRNMKLNEVDFGWGRPAWIAIAGDTNELMANVIVLVDGVMGDGIEAWILLDEKEMEILEQNPQFLEFALLNPSIHLSDEN